MVMDFNYLLMIAPALILAFVAQMLIRSSYSQASQIPASMTGAQAARHILDSNGLYDVAIEQVPGTLSDHYDPRAQVLRLSNEVYHGRSMAAVGIAAHEAGHALQHAQHYAPLVIRNAAVPIASIGSNVGLSLLIFGLIFHLPPLLLAGIVLFAAVVFFQLINLPVEFDASARAKTELATLGIVHPQDIGPVRKVLNSAALTYVAATLQSVLTLMYYLTHLNSRD